MPKWNCCIPLWNFSDFLKGAGKSSVRLIMRISKYITKFRMQSLAFNDLEVMSWCRQRSYPSVIWLFLVGKDRFKSLAEIVLLHSELDFKPCHFREASFCSQTPSWGSLWPLSTCYCGWMRQSETSHGESMNPPACSPSRSPRGCFWNQAQSLAKLSKQRCL